jgi:hypothetical protein
LSEPTTTSAIPTDTSPPAEPTKVPTTPEEVFTAAWQAFLTKDEALLASYYNAHGQQICKLGFGTMLRCVGIAYEARGLRNLEGWYIEEPLVYEDSGAFIFLITEWERANPLGYTCSHSIKRMGSGGWMSQKRSSTNTILEKLCLLGHYKSAHELPNNPAI